MFEAREFAEIARALLLAKGRAADAIMAAEMTGAGSRVIRILKDAAQAGSLSDPSWAGPLSDYGQVTAGFVASFRSAGSFDRMLGEMIQVPLRTRITATVVAASGSAVAEGALKPVTQLELANGEPPIRKAAGILVVSAELARAAGDAGVNFLERELRAAVAAATDMEALATLATGLTPIIASGVDPEAVRYDIGQGLEQLDTGADSRVFLIMDPLTAKRLVTMNTVSGEAAFPGMTITGGTIMGLTALVSDGLPADSSSPPGRTMMLVDAAQVVGGSDRIALSASREALVNLGDEVMTSLFQSNQLGLRAERTFLVEPARENVVSLISGVDYGYSEVSP